MDFDINATKVSLQIQVNDAYALLEYDGCKQVFLVFV